MDSPETFTIDGKEMKKCPGWEGNDFRCGRGDPRLIPVAKEVCEGCSRGMRKRGQASREEEERRERARQAEIEKLQRCAAGLPAGAKATLPRLIEAIEALTRGDLDGPAEYERYYHKEKLFAPDRWHVLRIAAGMPAEPER